MKPNDFIPYGRQTIDEDDIQAVTDVLRSPFLTTGPKVKEFEKAIGTYVNAAHAVAYSSGTAALHGAIAAAGVGPGDEILVPSMSFLATANAAIYVGAKPIFVDTVKGGFNIDPVDARRKVNARTKAIIPVHFAGEPVDLDTIHQLAKDHNLIVIEDAAHALGARYQKKMIGGLSAMTVFSFHPVKHITTAEGGMVTTQDPELARRLRQFRHHGIDIDVVERDARHQWRYDMTALGYNYRLSDIHCALGISQLKKSEQFLQQRETIAAAYTKAFSVLPSLLTPPTTRAGDRHSWHLYLLRFTGIPGGSARDELFRDLREKGIGVHVHYRPIHLHSYYKNLGWKAGDCPNSETIFETMLSLPMFPSMTDAMTARVIEEITGMIKQTA